MTEQEILQNKEQLDMLMCQKRYNEAEVLCNRLLEVTAAFLRKAV